MITGEYEYLKNLAEGNVCAECHGPLSVAWYGRENTHVLRCGQCPYPSSVTRELSLTELDRIGQLPAGPVKDNIDRREREKTMSSKQDQGDTTLALVARADLGTGEVLDPSKVAALIRFAEKYHLDPRRGHVVLMYGEPYIGLDGYLFHANRSRIHYKLESRPLNEQERKDYQITTGSFAWIATVTLVVSGGEFTGQGIVTPEEMTEESKKKPGQLAHPVVAAHPWQLAQKRAEWQALRRAFPIGETPKQEEE